MKNTIRNVMLGVIGAAALTLMQPAKAEAVCICTLRITLTTTGNDASGPIVHDVTINPLLVAPQTSTFSQIIGGFNITVDVAQWSQPSGHGNLSLTYAVQAYNNPLFPGTTNPVGVNDGFWELNDVLTIDVTGTDFAQPGGSQALLSATNSFNPDQTNGGSALWQGWSDPGNGLDGKVNEVDTATLTSLAVSSSPSIIFNKNGAYSLTGLLTVKLNGAQDFVSGNASIDSAPIPEPASLVLLGTGLLGAASRLRRKKQNVA